jgi:hypothetical protein
MDFLMKKLGLFECILLGVMARSFVVGPTASDAAVVIALVAAIVYVKDYLNRNKVEKSEEIKKELDHIKNEVNALKLDRGIKRIPTMVAGVSDSGSARRF